MFVPNMFKALGSNHQYIDDMCPIMCNKWHFSIGGWSLRHKTCLEPNCVKKKKKIGIPSTSHNLIDLKKLKGCCSRVGSPRYPHHMCLYELWDSSSGTPHCCLSGTCGIIHYRVTGCGVSNFTPTPPPPYLGKKRKAHILKFSNLFFQSHKAKGNPLHFPPTISPYSMHLKLSSTIIHTHGILPFKILFFNSFFLESFNL